MNQILKRRYQSNLEIMFNVFAILLIMLTASIAHSQTITRNSNDDIVVTYKDGSWRYFMASDSTLLLQEYQSFLAIEKKAREPVIELPTVELPVNESNEQFEIMEPGVVPIKSESEIEEEDVKTAIAVENESIDDEKNQLRLALMERRLTLTERVRRVESGYIQLTEKDLRKVKEELGLLNIELEQLDQSSNEHREDLNLDRGYQRSDYAFDVNIKTEPNVPCAVEVQVDEFSNRKVARVKPEFFFHSTPIEMRPYLKGGHYMDALASIKQSNGFTYLLVEFNVNSRNAQRDFGILEKEAQLKMKFLGGQTLTLFNTIRDIGRVSMDGNTCEYTGRYLLDAYSLKNIEKHDIDTIRISWSVGFEDYDIYLVDLLKQQLACLFKEL